MAKEDKLRALEAAINQIEKQYGKGSVMKLGDTSSSMKVETVPSGSISLDIALEELLKYMALNHQVRQQLHYMLLQRFRSVAV